MTRRDILTCIHEPFGDAFYYGPERLSTRYEEDVQGREASGFANSTYKSIFERFEKESKEVRIYFSLYPGTSSCSSTEPRGLQAFQASAFKSIAPSRNITYANPRPTISLFRKIPPYQMTASIILKREIW
jgi:hypothetical protein